MKSIDRQVVENVYLSGVVEVSVESLRNFLSAYSKSGSMKVAGEVSGVSSSIVRRRELVDEEFREAMEVVREQIKEMVEAKLVEGAMNGVVEEEWEENGRRYRRKQDYRYLERLLKEKVPEDKGFGGSILQVNFNGVEMVMAPKKVEEE